MKTFIAIMLAVVLLACDPDDSGSSSEPKKPDPVSQCAITKFQDQAGDKQAIDAMKDLDVGQTRTLFYECNIVPKDYDSKAKLAGFDNTVIRVSKAEIDILAKDEVKGSFTVTGLKVGTTQIKINLGKSTELALSIAYVVSRCAITQFRDESGKMQAITGGKINNVEKGYTLTLFYDCGIAKKDYGKKLNLAAYDDTVIQTSFKGITIPAQDKIASSFTVEGLQEGKTTSIKDGTDWKRLSQVAGDMNKRGSVVRFKNTLYQIAATAIIDKKERSKIWIYDPPNWKINHDFSDYLGYIDAVVFDGKIWIVGGLENEGASQKNLGTVSTFDGTNYQKVADLPNSKTIKWAAVEVFPRGLLAIGGERTNSVFWSRFGKTWTEFTGITGQSKLNYVISGATVVWNDALWAFSVTNKKLLKITYEE